MMNVTFSRTTFLLLCFAGSTWRRAEVGSAPSVGGEGRWGDTGAEGEHEICRHSSV